ncbi:hypothetical protein [Amycolatopsis pretoriensis]|uniref:hypothetical protein n=1 Tax=Amycolatopsis pretoriensis TaxID=218821 RepID=UPI00115FBFF3|nr:hypothetical protein [Amycolatopsis pretoriensis]
MVDTTTRVVPLSRARRWTWVLVVVALAFAGWHGYGITVAPERPYFWIGVALDVLVAVIAWLLGRAWPAVDRLPRDHRRPARGRVGQAVLARLLDPDVAGGRADRRASAVR